MSATLVSRNLATSCGYTGEAALELSTRDDRSRDPLYNQSKMYSELYKILGWIHPVKYSRLTFYFTYLGSHVAQAKKDPLSIFRECILGIAYPNDILEVKVDYSLRPFATILRTMRELGGLICRDEIIIGPLCLEDDRNVDLFNKMIAGIKSIRGNSKALDKQLSTISSTRKIALTTMGNYTRFPLAVLKWCRGVDVERRKDIYKKSLVFLKLTDNGIHALNHIDSSIDIRKMDLDRLNEAEKSAMIRYSVFCMLDRSGFDTDAVRNIMNKDSSTIKKYLTSKEYTLFSPFQELKPEMLEEIFTHSLGDETATPSLLNTSTKLSKSMPQLANKVILFGAEGKVHRKDNMIHDIYTSLSKKGLNIDQIVENVAKSYENADKKIFYPLVADLFKCLGYECTVSRIGVNYQRWDAFIYDSKCSVPIEIKSPSEEQFISVKAVRQALENKIVLLSRKIAPTCNKTTSLVVGFNAPNDRAEVNSLISDISYAFGIVIGVIDIRSLLKIVGMEILNNKIHDREQLMELHGIIELSNA